MSENENELAITEDKIHFGKTDLHRAFEKLNGLEGKEYLFGRFEKDGCRVMASAGPGIIAGMMIEIFKAFPDMLQVELIGILNQIALPKVIGRLKGKEEQDNPGEKPAGATTH